jgi:hypothetical protein
MVVKPEAALKQYQEEQTAIQEAAGTGDSHARARIPAAAIGATEGTVSEPAQPRRFHGSVKLDPTRVGRDAGRVADEVITHLVGLVDSDVSVTLEIHADIASGAPENVVRTVTENCRTLKFSSHGFEEE